MWSIARSLETSSSSIYGLLSRTGGIRPVERQRSVVALSLSEREEISRGLAQSLSIRSIAANLSPSPSTISREINRNGGLKKYRATPSDVTRNHLSQSVYTSAGPAEKGITAVFKKQTHNPAIEAFDSQK